MSVFRNKYLVMIHGALLSLFCDQFTKFWVERRFHLDESLPVFGDLFRITFKLNPGAAFGMFRGQPLPFFLVISTAALAFIVYFVARVAPSRHLLTLSLSVILGGALGNVSDRLRIGAVVDFLDCRWNDRIWPTFNVADVLIVVGVILFLWDMGRHEMRWEAAPVQGAGGPDVEAIPPSPEVREDMP